MSMFTDCSGQCCVCKISGRGCIAGHGDDYFTPASREEIQRRIDDNEYPQWTEYMIKYLQNNHDDIDRKVQGMGTVDTMKLINEFRSMAARGTLLARGNISQEDLLIQIEGTIVKVAMDS